MTHERAARFDRRRAAPQHSWLGIAGVRRDSDIMDRSNAPRLPRPRPRPAPALGRVQPAISCFWGCGYLELWVGVMPRLNDAKGGASSGPSPDPCLGILEWHDRVPMGPTALCQLFPGSLG